MNLHSNALERLGWTAELQTLFRPHAGAGLVPARVGAQHRGAYVLYTERGELWADLAGRISHEAGAAGGMPAVGDWVAARPLPDERRAVIQALLPRRTKFSRKAAGLAAEEQVVAANVDVVFVVSALAHDLSLRRLERYLASCWEGGADPVVVLTKADLCADLPARVAEVTAIALGVPVHAVSNVTGDGVDELRQWFGGNRTVALLGSSGVGKSSLVNRLLGEDVQAVREIRADGRGRHTTTHRELILLPGGGLVLDTPGMREVQLWDADAGVETAFDDVERLAPLCRFTDCRHESEPGCAVKAAVADGVLSPDRLEGYEKLRRELAVLGRRVGKRAEAEERRRWRVLNRAHRQRDGLRP